MSHGVWCDQGCGEFLLLDRSDGDDEYGERSGAWIRLAVAGDEFEVCSLSCAHQFLERDDVRKAIESNLAAVAEVARVIRNESNTESTE